MSTVASRPAGLETRRAILDAALDLFSERSFDGASTRAIAELAGVTQPLLNYHFAGKEELWRAAVDDLFERFRTSMQGRVSGLRGVDDVDRGHEEPTGGSAVDVAGHRLAPAPPTEDQRHRAVGDRRTEVCGNEHPAILPAVGVGQQAVRRGSSGGVC